MVQKTNQKIKYMKYAHFGISYLLLKGLKLYENSRLKSYYASFLPT